MSSSIRLLMVIFVLARLKNSINGIAHRYSRLNAISRGWVVWFQRKSFESFGDASAHEHLPLQFKNIDWKWLTIFSFYFHTGFSRSINKFSQYFLTQYFKFHLADLSVAVVAALAKIRVRNDGGTANKYNINNATCNRCRFNNIRISINWWPRR